MKTLVRWLVLLLIGAVMFGGLWPVAAPHSQAQGMTWTASVYNNPNLAGSPIWTGTSNSVNYTWGTGSPVINGTTVPGAPADNFSVRFIGATFFTAGNYRFTVQVDDGARLYVDGLLLINGWQTGSGVQTLQGDYNFTIDGNHTITVEMFETTGNASVVAVWALSTGGPTPPPGGTGTAWSAEFFNGPDLAGGAIFTTTYPASGLNQNWGQGSPGGAVPADNFSARFTRTIYAPNEIPVGQYTFYGAADDGFRFYIDQTLVFNQWDAFVPQTFTSVVTLLAGPHVFKFEYRELTVDARVFLTWNPPSAQNPQIGVDAAPFPVSQAAPQPTPAPGQPTPVPGQPPAPVQPASGIRGMVMGNLRIRSGPALKYEKIGLMPWGTEVDILGRDSGHAWYMVNYQGLIGWSYAPWIQLLTGSFDALPYTDGSQPVFAPPPTAGVIVQAFGNMRIRSGPGLQFPKISKVPWGTRVEVLARSSDKLWYKVRYGDVIGWSFASWYRPIQGYIGGVPVE